MQALGIDPEIYAHPDSLVTTFADMMINQKIENKRAGVRHGSCGIGLHETERRSELSRLKITMGDIWNGFKRLPAQLDEICHKYAEFRTGEPLDKNYVDAATEKFLKGCEDFANLIHPLGIGQCKDPVFEGAQGLLLDKDNTEYFPHVTHSNTGMKNVNILCQQAGITEKEIYYVSRTYLTRHGAGKLPGESSMMSFEDDTNVPNKFQGAIRFAPLDVTALKERCEKDAESEPWRLVLTHCDQLAPPCKADLYSDGPTRKHVSEKLKPQMPKEMPKEVILEAEVVS